MKKNLTAKQLKEQLQRDLKSVEYKKQYAAIVKQINKEKSKLKKFQNSCPHYDSTYKNEGSTGSWDRDDSFWRVWECNDCGKRWTTDQSVDHPYARQIK